MLETIRKHSASLLIKLLFGLLILSFVGWGVGDFIRGRSNVKVVAEVDGVEISPYQFDREYQREVARLERMFGTKLDRDQARALGLVDATLARVVNETLYDLGARSLGVMASDAAIRADIEKDKLFFDQSGKFNRAQFEQAMAANGFTEQSYVALLRQEMSRHQLASSVESGVTPPKSLVEAIYRFRAEKRVADTIFVADSAMTGIGEPSADDLAKFHTDHAAQFTAPEYRQLTLITFHAKDLEDEVSVSDQEIRDLYAQRQDEFNRPEMRHLEQIVVQDEAKAQDIYKQLSEGRDFATVAKDAAGLDKNTIDIGEVSRSMLLPELADPAFALPDKGVSQPVKSPLGWHIIKVVSISPAHKETIDEARAVLTAEAKHEKAIDALYKMANKLEDSLGGGATLEEASKTLNLSLRKIATVDATGHDPKGKAVADLPAGKFLQTAFETPENEDSLVTEAGTDGYFVVHVDKITPSAVRPLDTVRDQVAAAWAKAQRETKAKTTAEDLVKRLKDGADLAQIAGELGIKVETTEPFTRSGAGKGPEVPRPVIGELFKGKVGDVASGRGTDGYVVARLKEIQPANPAADSNGVATVERTLTNSLRSDVQAEFATTLRGKFPVTINQKVLDESF